MRNLSLLEEKLVINQFPKLETYFTTVLENSTVGIITIDLSGKIFFFNSSAEKLFGYIASETTDKNINYLIPELFKGFNIDEIKEFWNSSKKIKFGSGLEVSALRKDGTTFPANLTFNEVWKEKERFFSVIVRNISEKKITEKKLREAQKLNEIFFDHVKEGILGVDLDGKISFVSSTGASLLGYEVEELKGHSFYSTIYHSKSKTPFSFDVDNIVSNALKDGKTRVENDQIFLNKYGLFVSVNLKLSPIINDNEIQGLVIAFRNNELTVDPDLRERIFFEMSKVISQSLNWENTIQQTLQIIGENLSWELANYWEIDLEENNLKCVEQWRASFLKSETISNFQNISKVIRFSKGEGLPGEVWSKGKPVWISQILGEKNFPREPFGVKAGLHSGYASPVYAGEEIIGVFEFFTSTPQEHLDPNLTPLLVGLGGQLGQLKKRLESEKDLIVAKEQAIKADNFKSEFLSQMSHELRTPLNAIIGFAQILVQSKKPVLDEKHVSDVNLIYESGMHLLRLINEILDLSKIESGKMSISIEPISLNKLLTETIASIRPMAQKANITLKEFISGSEDIDVLADVFRLRQVVLNLVANGIKYNKLGGSVSISRELKNNDYVRISIQDTGKGIPEDFKSKIFNPFERGGEEFSNVEGTGIGLSVTKKLVELMNGEIGFQSVENEGSCFYVDIPLAPIDSLPTTFSDSSSNCSIKKLNVKRTGAQKTIQVLYIEDNIRNLQLVKRVVEGQENINLFCAEDGLSGLDSAIINLPDLILLDIHLPKMNGFEVFLRLKELETTKNIPVIAVSANARNEDIKKAKEMGFKDYLTKPLKIDSLIEALNSQKA